MRNGNTKLVLCVLVCALGVVALVHMVSDKPSRLYPRIEFGETTQGYGELTLAEGAIPKDIPSQLTMYKVDPPTSKKTLVLGIIRALPLPTDSRTADRLRLLNGAPESFRDEDGVWGASIADWEVEMWDGGQFLIDNDKVRASLRNSEFRSPRPPTDEEARKAADAFLARLKPFLPEVQFSKVGVGEEIIRGLGDKPGDRVVLLLNVSYSAKLGGIPLTAGVGVSVASGGKIAGLSNHVRRVVPDGIAPILTPQEAFVKLHNKEGHIVKGDSMAGTVTSVELRYYLQALARKLSYIMPVYRFEGEGPGFKGRPDHWTAYVEAVRPESLERKRPRE